MSLKRRIDKIEGALNHRAAQGVIKMTDFPPAPETVEEWVDLNNAINGGDGCARVDLMQNKKPGHQYNAWLKRVTKEVTK